MEDPSLQLTPEQVKAIVDEFETLGFYEFKAGRDQQAYDALLEHITSNHVPHLTEVDERAGTITITRRTGIIEAS